ncbi:MAG: hypothetical protein JXD22_00885 [Sedimentisphaerales bacterium]|nr:hypothetical protein [Sedimentisphaerales bacterium]
MSSIPPNIIGSVFQAQAASAEAARKEDSKRNKRLQDSRELTRLADQQQSEVEDTEHTDQARVRRQDERERDGQDARDILNAHKTAKIYHPDGSCDDSDGISQNSPDSPKPDDHIDLNA